MEGEIQIDLTFKLPSYFSVRWAIWKILLQLESILFSSKDNNLVHYVNNSFKSNIYIFIIYFQKKKKNDFIGLWGKVRLLGLGMATGRIWTGSRWTRIQIRFLDLDSDSDPRVQFCRTQIRIRGYCGSSTGSRIQNGSSFDFFFFCIFKCICKTQKNITNHNDCIFIHIKNPIPR